MVPPAWFLTLPEDLRNRARSLRDQHINEDAFAISDALEALSHLRDVQAVVLGGDFWEQSEHGDLRPAHENWYLSDRRGEALEHRARRSIAEAESQIKARAHRSELRVVLVCKLP